MRISYYALGCKVNEYEATAIINRFIEEGYELVDFHNEADVCIINTCTVTASADAKSRKLIRQAIRRNPNGVIAIMGCYSQLRSKVDDFPEVDIIIGTKDRHLLFDLIIKAQQEKQNYYHIENINIVKNYEELKINRYNNRTRGFVKIEDGCDNFCSYCAIPYARGRVRSRKPEDVINEIKRLTNSGSREIVLSGINTAAYGKDLINYQFSNLLEDIFTKIPELGRIRISSIEITEITDELLDVLSKYKNHFCDHFHIPLQGGTNKILSLMNRKYQLNDYEQKINKIRTLFPTVNITTDIMVGFPGESDYDFQEGKDFIERMAFGEMHVFPFSIRPGTRAEELSNQISNEIKKERVKALLALNDKQSLRYRMFFEGKDLDVIVEKMILGVGYGHSANYIGVNFNGNDINLNQNYKIRVTKASYPISRGEIIV